MSPAFAGSLEEDEVSEVEDSELDSEESSLVSSDEPDSSELDEELEASVLSSSSLPRRK